MIIVNASKLSRLKLLREESKEEESRPGIIMLTPFHKSQRGNSVTSARLQNGLAQRGFRIKRLSLEDSNWLPLLQETVASREYAILHAFHGLHCGKVLAAVPEIKVLPLILTTTGTDLNCDLKGVSRNLVLDAFRTAQKIVVFSDYYNESILKEYPEAEDKLVTIPQGVSLADQAAKSRTEMGIAEEAVVFLLPSGLRPAKNIELAINALKKVKQKFPQLHLLIMGAAIDHDYSKQILGSLENLDWVSYLGEIPHAKIAGYLLAGDVVINSSISEGQPQGALEAMSLGKPCILTAVAGNLGLIESGVEGFYVNSEEEMVNAAAKMIQDTRSRQRMGLAARKLAESRFTVECELEAYRHLYLKFV